MARYPLNLPQSLKLEAEAWAQKQGVSLNQFILWATAAKVGALNQSLDDPDFPQITYRRGTSGIPVPILSGTGIRVQAVAVADEQWGMTAQDIAVEYGISEKQIEAAIAFFELHRTEIETHIEFEARLAVEANG